MRYCLLLLTACGGGGDLTCALLADPTNCWATAANEAAACLAMRDVPAQLSADRTTCSWSDGSKVTFDAPLPQSTFELDHLTMDAIGMNCGWHFEDTFQNHLELTAGGRTETATLEPDRTFELACDDGSTYETSFDTLFTCAPPSAPPTDGFDIADDGTFTFTLDAVNLTRPLFSCK